MSDIPDSYPVAAEVIMVVDGCTCSDCINRAQEIIDRAILTERQRSDSLKTLCDEMAKDFQRIEALDYKRAAVNGAAYEAHVIAYCALDRYRKEKEVGNGQ